MPISRPKPDTILIIGTGYTGKELTRLAGDSDFRVVGTTRSDDTVRFLTEHGADAIRWELEDETSDWTKHLGETTAVVYSIPTLYRTYEPPANGVARHIEPVARVLAACRNHGAARFIYLSSTSVYGDHHGEWVDETSERRPVSPFGKMRADIEDYLMDQNTTFPINVARLVGIYGPGRTLVDYIKSERYTLVDGGKKATNRIHVHDIARGLMALLERGSGDHRIYNFSDGHPQRSRDLVEFICNQTGIEPPREETLEEYASRRDDPNAVARRKSSIRVLNDRLRTELDFSLVYPDVFTGYEAILGQD